MFTLVQIADLHTPFTRAPRARDLASKRLLGWLSWKVRRVHTFHARVLDALIEDLCAQPPDQIAITGDLTNLALESEFLATCEWLGRLGDPTRVSLVPGNHDAYVRVPMARSWQHWARYLLADAAAGAQVRGIEDFPTLRVHRDVALVGLCSAHPTAPLLASGSLGRGQLRRLEAMLEDLGRRGRCRVVQVHHPPIDRGVSWRRRLRDSKALRGVLERAGAELVVHAHLHRATFGNVAGPRGPIPVVGVRPGSSAGSTDAARAQYHRYRIERTSSGEFRIDVVIREWDDRQGRFQTVSIRDLAGGAGLPAERAA